MKRIPGLTDRQQREAARIIHLTARHFHLSPAALASARQTAEVVLARNVAMCLVAERLVISSAMVGKIFRKDRTLLLHARRDLAVRAEQSRWIREALDGLRRSISTTPPCTPTS